MQENLPPELANLNIWQLAYMFVASCCGATISVMLRILDGEKLSRLEIFASYFCGICLAMFFSNMVGIIYNIPPGISMTVGGTSMMAGMLGISGFRKVLTTLRKWGEKS